MYVADWKEVNSKKLQDILDETIELLKLNQRIDISNEERQVSKWEYVQISTNCCICLFDRSDEALINDYVKTGEAKPDIAYGDKIDESTIRCQLRKDAASS